MTSTVETSDRQGLSSSERVVLLALALMVTQLLLRGWAAGGSWFYSDDFIFLGATAYGDADTGWLFHPHNVHLMPLGLYLATLVGHAGAFSWWLAVAQILIMQLLASLACWWMLRRLFGDRKGILIALAIYLFAPFSFPTVVWWSASLNQLPHQIALFGAVAAHVGYLRTRHPSQAALAALFLLVGYASYAKSALIPVVLVIFTVLYFTTGPLWARLRMAFTRYWHGWALYSVLTFGYLIAYFIKVPTTERPGVRGALDTLDLSITQAFAPAAIGGPWIWQNLGALGGVGPRLFVATPMFFVVVSWLVLATFWSYQSLRHHRAWWPLLILGPYLVLGGLLIAAGRTEAFGSASAGLELRYIADLGGILALCVGLTTMPVIGASRSIAPRSAPLLAIEPPRRLLQVAGVVFLVGSLVSSVSYAAPWHDDAKMPQHGFVDQVRTQIKDGPVTVADSGVSDDVLWSVAFPYNLVSRLLSPFGEKIRVVKAGNDLQVFGPTGTLGRAIVDGDPRSTPGPNKGCGYAVGRTPITIPLVGVLNFSFWMTINYLAAQDGTARVTAGDNDIEVEVEKGPHTLFVQTEGAFSDVTISAEGTLLCVDAVNVGPLSVMDPQ